MTEDTNKTATLALHMACLLLCAFFWTLGFTVLKPYPEASIPLISSATWLYGKLMFKPSNPVLDNIIQKLEPARVDLILSQRPPAKDPAVSPGVLQ